MKKFYLYLTLIICITVVEAREYAVISLKDFGTLSSGKIKAVYLKKISFLHDTKVVPVNLGSQDAVRRSFERHVLHMNFSRLKSYWIKQHYLGHRPPVTMKSQAGVKAFVKKVDGAIGYIEMDNLEPDFKILYRWSD